MHSRGQTIFFLCGGFFPSLVWPELFKTRRAAGSRNCLLLRVCNYVIIFVFYTQQMFLRRRVFFDLHYHLISTSVPLTAGHNKWSKVKRQKEVLDPRRSLVFSKIRNQIATAVKLGGGPDPTINSVLARAIEKAKEAKMPKSTIEKCLNSSSADTSERVIFEIRGNSGYLLLVECMTEHKHRHNIKAELKRILERNSRYYIYIYIYTSMPS